MNLTTRSSGDRDGLLTGAALGSVATAQGYNAFGELTSSAAAFAGALLYSASYTRDRLGRIFQKTETVGGVTDTWVYSYDPAGARRSGSLR